MLLSQKIYSTQDRLESMGNTLVTSKSVADQSTKQDENEQDKVVSNGQYIEEVFRRRLFNLF